MLLCVCVCVYPCTGRQRMFLMLEKILSTTSGSRFEPNSAAMMDWLISEIEVRVKNSGYAFFPHQLFIQEDIKCIRVSLFDETNHSIIDHLHQRVFPLVEFKKYRKMRMKKKRVKVSWNVMKCVTSLMGDLERFSVTEGSFPPAGRVHLILYTAVHHTKL